MRANNATPDDTDLGAVTHGLGAVDVGCKRSEGRWLSRDAKEERKEDKKAKY